MDLSATIAGKKARLDRLRPLSPGSVAALDAWDDVELTYTSNAIEGSTLTRTETVVVLEKGITVAGRPLKDHLDAIGHRDALHFARALAATSEPIREVDIREIHSLVFRRSEPETAGVYSRHQRAILGSPLRLPSPGEIAPLMAEFAAWLAVADASAETASEAHHRLVTIHPFADGNGRTARLLMNLVLIRAGFPPITIGPEERVRYIDTIRARQVDGDVGPWSDFFLERLAIALDRHLDMVERGLS